MLSVSDPWRVCRAIAVATLVSACASRTSPSAFPRPAAFPNATTAASIKAETSSGPAAGGASELVQTALSLAGVPYQWGGDQPGTGFDCSGFVRYVLGQHQITAPRTSAEQFTMGRDIALDEVRAGDLVFFSTIAAGASHVGLAISSEEFVHAPATFGVVRVERVRAPYWRARYVGARRIF